MLTALSIGYVVVVPLVVLIYWTYSLVSSKAMDGYVAVGIPLIVTTVLMIVLGFTDWFAHRWYLTKFTKVMLISAVMTGLLFCFIVIFGASAFTYNGSTALFLAVNFVFAVTLTLMKPNSSSE